MAGPILLTSQFSIQLERIIRFLDLGWDKSMPITGLLEMILLQTIYFILVGLITGRSYTQIDIRDAAENDLTPYLRWNALSLDWGTTGNTPPVMYSGESYPLTVVIQNTGKGTWYSNQVQTVYFTYHYHNPRTGITDSSGNWETVTTGIAPGVETTVMISINDVPGWYEPGPYILQLDMIRQTGIPQSLEWFSDQGWPTLDIPVCLNGPCQVFLPAVMKNYSQ